MTSEKVIRKEIFEIVHGQENHKKMRSHNNLEEF